MLIKSNKSLYKALPQNSRGEYEISLSLDEVEELIRESINLTPKVTGRVQGTGKEALTAKTQGVCTGDKPYLNPKTNSCEEEPATPSSRTQSQAEVQRKTQEQRKAEKDAAKPSQQARVKGLQTPRKALESFQPREAKFHGETAVEYAIAARQAWKSGDSFTAIDLMEQARNHYSELMGEVPGALVERLAKFQSQHNQRSGKIEPLDFEAEGALSVAHMEADRAKKSGHSRDSKEAANKFHHAATVLQDKGFYKTAAELRKQRDEHRKEHQARLTRPPPTPAPKAPSGPQALKGKALETYKQHLADQESGKAKGNTLPSHEIRKIADNAGIGRT